jgi:carboxypeptidase Q
MKKRFTFTATMITLLAAGFLHISARTMGAAESISETNSPPRPSTSETIARIRDEGMNRSQVMQTLSYLTDVIGPRLTGSPNLRRANEWTRDKMTSWGLTNAHLEAWGPFGRGWELKSFSAQIVEPQTIPLIAWPKAWTPGFDKPITAPVVLIEAKSETDLEKYKGKLKGAIVLASSVRDVRARFEPMATRIAESNLLRMANAGPGGGREFFPGRPGGTNSLFGTNSGRAGANTNLAATSTNAARTNATPGQRGVPFTSSRILAFAAREEAALFVTSSSEGDGGTLFVAEASVPGAPPRSTNSADARPRISVWSTNVPAMLAQIAVATEDYNRLARMIKQEESLKMTVDLRVKFHDADLMAYNTIAEIPGSDLKDELVMIGAHMDSWHSGTGATDNGAGVAATMEAMRILKALNLQPRRTIRIAQWTGEEQGLLGSKAYVAKHFGYYTNTTNVAATRSPRGESNTPRRTRTGPAGSSARKLVRQDEHEKLSAYFNLDNGTGKIRGVYMQGNEAVRPLFRKWLQPFSDLGAETLTLGNTGGTDHLAFDGVGLPGFQFIQDPLDYWTRTHHSNADVFDRIQAEDMKQASTVMAAFLYSAAMMDEKVPRKTVE